MNFKKPKLTIPKTKSESIWDLLGYLFYFGSILFLIIIWSDLPNQVPAHYNAGGEVDRLGSKWELLILVGVGAFILIFMRIFEKFPHLHTYPMKFNESNAKEFYLASRKLINQLKNISLIVFGFILFESVAIAKGWSEGFGVLMLPLLVVGFFIPIIIVIIKFRKIE